MGGENHPSDPEIEERVPYPSIGQSVGILIIVVLMCVVCSPLIFLEGLVGGEPAMLIYYVAAFASALLVVRRIRINSEGGCPFRWHLGSWRMVVLLALGTLGLVHGLVGPLANLVPATETLTDFVQEAAEERGLATFLVMVLAAPVFEELLFRGIMLDGLLRRYRPPAAILASSVLFGAAHLNAIQFITGLVLGLFLGWVYWRTRSVGPCVVIHMVANGAGFMMRFFIEAEDLEHAAAGYFHGFGGVGMFLLIVGVSWLVGGLSIWLLKREFDGDRRPSPWAEPAPPA